MLGRTNAVAGSAGMDVVTAINETGGAVAKGDKIWVLKTNVVQQGIAGTRGSPGLGQWYDGVYFDRYSARYYRWNGAVLESVPSWNLISTYVHFVYFRNGMCFNKESIATAWGTGITLDVYYICNGRYVVKFNSSDRATYLLPYDKTTGAIADFTEAVAKLGTIQNNICYMRDDEESYAASNVYQNKLRVWSDIRDNATMRTFALPSDYSFIYFTNDWNDGSYAIGGNDISGGGVSLYYFCIYKFTGSAFEDGSVFAPAEDLPASLQAFIGKECCVKYNNDAGILAIACDEIHDARVYKWVSGAFEEVVFEIDWPDALKTKTELSLTVSPDLTEVFLAWKDGNYNGLEAYKLFETAGKYYAVPYSRVNSYALTGVVASGGAEGADVQVSTVLPEVEELRFCFAD